MRHARLFRVAGYFTLLRTFAVLSALILAAIAAVLIQRVDTLSEGIELQQESTLAIGQAKILLYDGLSAPARASLTSRLANRGPLDHRALQQLYLAIRPNMHYAGAVRIKIWNTNGTIVYSDSPQAMGRHFPIDEDLALVLSGKVDSAASISDLGDPENVTERNLYKRLLEVYVVIRSPSLPGQPIVGAFEEYHDLTNLYSQMSRLTANIVLSIGGGFAMLYVSLFFVVRSASRRLVRQGRENATLLQEAILREQDASLIYGASERFRVGAAMDTVLKGVLDAVSVTFGYLSCEILSYSEEGNCLIVRAYTGEPRDLPPDYSIPLGEGIIGLAAQERRMIQVPDLSPDSPPWPAPSSAPDRQLRQEEKRQHSREENSGNNSEQTMYLATPDPTGRPGSRPAASVIVLPMIAGDALIGVLKVESDRRAAFGERDIRVLSILAGQAALALQNANLFSQRDDLYLATLDAMARTIDARDPYTAGHSQRVAQYSVAIGKALGLDQTQISSLERGGVLHDIGKIGVSDAVLRKPGPLTPEERAEIEQHPVIGYALLRDMSFIAAVLEMVRHHHERWDGKGYPDRLAGQEIPVTARIMAVADAFDSMTSNRPYRNSLSLQVARSRLLDGSGTQFWPPAVDALVEIIDACALPTVQREPLSATA